MNTHQTASATENFEIVSFCYNEEVSFEAQQQATETLNDIVSKFTGFVSRTYYYSKENNRWFDFIVWDSLENAKRASEQVMSNPDALNVFSLMNDESMIFSHYEKLGGVSNN